MFHQRLLVCVLGSVVAALACSVGCGKKDSPTGSLSGGNTAPTSGSPAASDKSAAIARSVKNIKEIGRALALYALYSQHLPVPRTIPVGWRGHLMTYLEAQAFPYDGTQPWDGPNNKNLPLPGVFLNPRWQKKEDAPRETYYQAFVGASETEAAAFGKAVDFGKEIQLADIRKGNSMPLVVVEAAVPVPWLQPVDIDIAKPLPKLGGPRQEDFLGLFLDLSGKTPVARVALFPANTPEKDLRLLINYLKKPDRTIDFKIVE